MALASSPLSQNPAPLFSRLSEKHVHDLTIALDLPIQTDPTQQRARCIRAIVTAFTSDEVEKIEAIRTALLPTTKERQPSLFDQIAVTARQVAISEKELLSTKALRTRLKDHYLSLYHHSPSLHEEKSSHIEKLWIPLQAVSIDGPKEKPSDCPEPLDIFHLFQEREIHQVCISGKEGAGKTTLLNTIALEWANEMSFHEFSLVLHLSLMNENVEGRNEGDPIDWLAHVVQKNCFNASTPVESLADMIRSKRGSILLLVDDYDRADTSTRTFVHRLISDPGLYSLITTSSSSKMLASHSASHLHLKGLSNYQIEEYLTSYLPNQEDLSLFQKITQEDHLLPLARSPRHLQILCSLSRHNFDLAQLDGSLTSLYGAVLDSINRVERETLAKIGEHLHHQLTRGEHVLNLDLFTIEKKGFQSFLNSEQGGQYSINDPTWINDPNIHAFAIAEWVLQLPEEEKKAFIATYRYVPGYLPVFRFFSGLFYQRDITPDKSSFLSFLDALSTEPHDLTYVYHLELLLTCIAECKDISFLGNSQNNSGVIKTFFSNLSSLIPSPTGRGRQTLQRFSQLISLFSSPPLQRVMWDQTLSALQSEEGKELGFWLIANGAPFSAPPLEIITELLRIIEEDVSSVEAAANALSCISSFIPLPVEALLQIADMIDCGDSKDPTLPPNLLLSISGSQKLPIGVIRRVSDLLKSSSNNTQYLAAATLGFFGTYVPLPEDVISSLITLLHSSIVAVRKQVVLSLAQASPLSEIPNEGILSIASLLDDYDEEVKRSAANALASLHAYRPLEEEVLLDLTVRIGQGEWYTHQHIVHALLLISQKGFLPEKSFPILLAYLKVVDDDTVHAIVQILGEASRFSTIPPEVPRALFSLLKGSDIILASAIATALSIIDKQHTLVEEDFKSLFSYLSDKEVRVREIATAALKSISIKTPIPSEYHLKVFSLIEEKNHRLLIDAIQTIVSIHLHTPLNDEQTFQLAKLLNHLDGGIRMQAALALGKISSHGPFPREVLIFIIDRLSSSQPGIQASAAMAFGEIGRSQHLTDEQLTPLLHLLVSSDIHVRSSAREALEKIGQRFPPSESVLNTICQLLYRNRNEVKNDGLLLLAALPPGEKIHQRTLMKLLDLVRSGPDFLRINAIKALVNVVRNETQANRGIKTLLTLLFNSNDSLREAAQKGIETMVTRYPLSEENLAKISVLGNDDAFPAVSRVALASISLPHLAKAALSAQNRVILSSLLHQATLRGIPLILDKSPVDTFLKMGGEEDIPLSKEDAVWFEEASKQLHPWIFNQIEDPSLDRGSKSRTCLLQ